MKIIASESDEKTKIFLEDLIIFSPIIESDIFLTSDSHSLSSNISIESFLSDKININFHEQGFNIAFFVKDKKSLVHIFLNIIETYRKLEQAQSKSNSNRLSPKQKEILKLIVYGYTNKHIATELKISKGTAKNYVSSILQSLGVPNRTAAAFLVTSEKKEET